MMQITYTAACSHAQSQTMLRPVRYIVGGVAYVAYACVFCAEDLYRMFDAECICEECRPSDENASQSQ